MRKAIPNQQMQLQMPTKVDQLLSPPSWVAVGFDISLSVIAGAMTAYDARLDQMLGPTFVEYRWKKSEHFFNRLMVAAKGHELVLDLIYGCGAFPRESSQVHIGIEEPVPYGLMSRKKFEAKHAIQQAENIGAFMSSLLRWGWNNIYEVNNATWQSLVCQESETPWKERNKFTSKKWALGAYSEIPEWEDIVDTGDGYAARPEEGRGAKAQALWCDDRYDALAVCAVIQAKIESGEVAI